MIERVIETLTLLTLLIPFTYLFKEMVNLKTRVTLLEAKIVLLLIILQDHQVHSKSTAERVAAASTESE